MDSILLADTVALLPPLRWPRKVICAGVNYRKHMREMGGEIPESSRIDEQLRRRICEELAASVTWRPGRALGSWR